jgi:hypothetical protein
MGVWQMLDVNCDASAIRIRKRDAFRERGMKSWLWEADANYAEGKTSWQPAVLGTPDAAFAGWACGHVKSSDMSGKAADKVATAAAIEAILGHWQGFAQQFQNVVFDIDRRAIRFRGCKPTPYDMARSSVEPLGRRITIEFKTPAQTSQCLVRQDDFITFFVNDDNTVDENLSFDRSRDALDSRESESGGFFDHEMPSVRK